MNIRILLIDERDKTVGRYRSQVRPLVGELIDANNGTWIVSQIQHDVCGFFADDSGKWDESALQGTVIAYVRKLAKADQRSVERVENK